MIDLDSDEEAELDRRIGSTSTLAALDSTSSLAALDLDEDVLTVVRVPSGRRLRVWGISDVHVEHVANRKWLTMALPDRDPACFDALVLAGDVASSVDILRDVLTELANSFDAVSYVDGNHEMWLTKKGAGDFDSLGKQEQMKELCFSLGVHTEAVRFVCEDCSEEDVVVLPLESWYHDSWDTEPELPRELVPPFAPGARWTDFSLVKWPEWITHQPGFEFGGSKGLTSKHMSEFYARKNEAALSALQRRPPKRLITFSHYCPRIELLPEKRFLVDPHIAKVSGSVILEAQIRQAHAAVAPGGSALHLYGHTHIAMDLTLEGVRYIHWPLGYPREARNQSKVTACSGLLLLLAGGGGGAATAEFVPPQWTFWSEFYREHGRDTAQTELAPWVRRLYEANYGMKLPPVPAGGPLAALPGKKGRDLAAFYLENAVESRAWRSCDSGRLLPLIEAPLRGAPGAVLPTKNV